MEIRRHWVVSDIDWLEDKSLWKGLKSIGMVQRERHIGEKISCEISYYLLAGNMMGKCLLIMHVNIGVSKINSTGGRRVFQGG